MFIAAICPCLSATTQCSIRTAPTIGRLQSKVGALTMDNELLSAKIERLESGPPLAARRSKR